MATQLFTRKGDVWLKTCGCGGKWKPEDVVEIPEGTTPVFMHRAYGQEYIGPATGIHYQFHPQSTALDVDSRDAALWLEDGTARPPMQGHKGHFARV